MPGPNLPFADDDIDRMLIDVRANTQGFAADIAAMRASVDGTLVEGFTRAGTVLERSLLGAIRRGSLGFADLKRIAFAALDDIAMQAARSLMAGLPGGAGASPGGLLGNLVGPLLGSVLGLPGRATGGPVSPGRGYIVGERGPELFVPTSAGRVEAPAGGAARDVRVSINLTTPPRSDVPQSLQRSSRQLASAVRRALSAG